MSSFPSVGRGVSCMSCLPQARDVEIVLQFCVGGMLLVKSGHFIAKSFLADAAGCISLRVQQVDVRSVPGSIRRLHVDGFRNEVECIFSGSDFNFCVVRLDFESMLFLLAWPSRRM